MELKRIAIDTSKQIFTLHGVDASDRPLLRRELRRGQVETFFRKQPPCEVALEACGASHHWGRVLTALGHRVVLVPAHYVKPYVKRGKNDRTDAAAICEAAGRPEMRFVPVKSAERQAATALLRVRDALVKQRTQLVNIMRGLAAEFGVVAAKGICHVPALQGALAQAELPALARLAFGELAAAIADREARIKAAEAQLMALHKADPVSRRLVSIPGVGPITAISLALAVEPERFASGRHLAAWIGLTPQENSTGGKTRLGGISRAGNERLRQLLVVGAMSVIRHAVRPNSHTGSAWLRALLVRKARKLAAVALANKIARVAWAMMARGEAYRPNPAAA